MTYIHASSAIFDSRFQEASNTDASQKTPLTLKVLDHGTTAAET